MNWTFGPVFFVLQHKKQLPARAQFFEIFSKTYWVIVLSRLKTPSPLKFHFIVMKGGGRNENDYTYWKKGEGWC